MQNFLIVGGDGLIGSSLREYLTSKNKKMISTTRRIDHCHVGQIYFDLSKQDNLQLPGFTHAFLCAGITNIATCEADPEFTSSINVDATFRLAEQLLKSGCRVIVISSNTVFDGNMNYPNEDSPYKYDSEYGRQKVELERRLLLLGAGVTIVRITKVVSLNLAIFSTMLQKLKSGQSCELFDDLLFCPISINYLCDSLYKIAESNCDGIFHISGEKDVSYAQFAMMLSHYLKISSALVKPTHANAVHFKPQYAGLGMQRTSNLLSIFPEPIHSVFTQLISDR